MKVAPPPDPRYEALLQLLRTADSLWNASRLFFTPWDLSPAQFNVLNLLSDRAEGLTKRDLGRELLTHRSNVTGLVDRLERRGLVCRFESDSDRRAWSVRLTPAGHRLLQEVLPRYHAAAVEIWEGVKASSIRETADVLRLLEQNARRAALPD